MGTTESATATPVQQLPESVTVSVNGVDIVAPKRIAESGNPWFNASLEFEAPVSNGQTDAEILQGLSISSAGVEFSTTKTGVHVSEPQRFKKGEKAGQVKDWTGGNLTVTHQGNLGPFQDGETVRRYRLQATITVVSKPGKERKVTVTVKANNQVAPKPRQREQVGVASGNPFAG